jgi:hypothetical protein
MMVHLSGPAKFVGPAVQLVFVISRNSSASLVSAGWLSNRRLARRVRSGGCDAA